MRSRKSRGYFVGNLTSSLIIVESQNFEPPSHRLTTANSHFFTVKYMPSVPADINQHVHILKLPMELLIKIAELVKGLESEEITVFKTKYRQLKWIALVHRKLRTACLAAGLYDRVAPHCKLYKPSIELSHPLFQAGKGLLKSLGIDLENMEAWPVCEVIMEQFPNLEELSFTGKHLSQKEYSFAQSRLASRIQQFKGTSLILRDTTFMSTLSDIYLSRIVRERIIQLDFDGSQFSWQYQWSRTTELKPLFPNLKKVKFRGSYGAKDFTMADFPKFVLDGCQITHLEVIYNSGPHCCGEYDHKRSREYDHKKKLMKIENSQYYTWLKNALLYTLSKSSHQSLQFFIVKDRFEDTFVKRNENGIIPFAFSGLKIVIFHCGRLDLLIETEDSCATNDCPQHWRASFHHHSAWLHLADEYSYFYRCDCLLLETLPSHDSHPTTLPDSFWNTASTRLLSRIWFYERDRPALRYFIVGNHKDRYRGIERDLNIPFEINPDTEEVESWAYTIMSPMDCRRILDERLKYL